MEIVLIVVAVWVVASLAVALLVGRFLRVADRRERAAEAPESVSTRSLRQRARASDAAAATEVHETA